LVDRTTDIVEPALVVDDYRSGADTPHLWIRHRPETDTPIKNGGLGQRTVGIS
jgi:hypothetical protein